jgi:hypothetical protein
MDLKFCYTSMFYRAIFGNRVLVYVLYVLFSKFCITLILESVALVYN